MNNGIELEQLREQLKLSAGKGQIFLDKQRMILIHAEAMGSLRRELIETLGKDRAKGLLLRMGYASGARDAELARKLLPEASDTDLLMVGPNLHNMEGIVHVTAERLEMDIAKGHFDGEFLWMNSFEDEAHRSAFGISEEPECWMQIGYACGYTTHIMGKFILYKEVECGAKGDPYCRIVGKPLEKWEDGDFWIRYFRPDHVADRLLELQLEVENLRYSIESEVKLGDMVGESDGFMNACTLVKKAAKSQITVLLLGETGVGKEMFARGLHEHSGREQNSFVAVNCAAIPDDLVESELFGVEKGAYTGANKSRPGRFERAHGGTLFLDEVGELSLAAQAKLLRVLQEGEVERVGDTVTRKVDVRLVAATNRDLQQAVEEGTFRADLYYRLAIYPVLIPPLRERAKDIPLLVQRFIDKHSARHGYRVKGITDNAMNALLRYQWPGNIRELENIIERGVILSSSDGYIHAELLFPSLSPFEIPSDDRTTEKPEEDVGKQQDFSGVEDVVSSLLSNDIKLDDLEKTLLETAVERADGNLASAARLLGLSRPQLAYRLKKISESDQ